MFYYFILNFIVQIVQCNTLGDFSPSTYRAHQEETTHNELASTIAKPRSNYTMSGNNVVDIQALIENYAWEHFLDLQHASRKNEHKGLERDDVHFEINLKQLLIEHEEPEYNNFQPTSSKPASLFKTVFTNHCARNQEYSFKTDRTTESTCTILRESGYAFGVQAELSLKTPCEVVEARAGFSHEIHFTKATENTICEMLTWGVDSNIVVPPKHQTTAELVVEEMSYNGLFNLTTHFSGRVTVSMIRRKDSALVMPLTLTIVELFRDSINAKHGQNLKTLVTIDKNAVKMITKGSCHFQFAMKQRVEVKEEPVVETK